jgi:hypothetical protein
MRTTTRRNDMKKLAAIAVIALTTGCSLTVSPSEWLKYESGKTAVYIETPKGMVLSTDGKPQYEEIDVNTLDVDALIEAFDIRPKGE